MRTFLSIGPEGTHPHCEECGQLCDAVLRLLNMDCLDETDPLNICLPCLKLAVIQLSSQLEAEAVT